MAEFWDVYDINGKKLNKTIRRDKEWLGEGEYHMGSMTFIVDENDNFLIQQRALTKKTLPGKWAITGGAALAGENRIQCAIREVSEELGIKLTPEKLHFLKQYVERNVIINIFSAHVDSTVKIKKQNEEVEQIKWVSRQQLVKMYATGDFIQPYVNEMLEKIK